MKLQPQGVLLHTDTGSVCSLPTKALDVLQCAELIRHDACLILGWHCDMAQRKLIELYMQFPDKFCCSHAICITLWRGIQDMDQGST